MILDASVWVSLLLAEDVNHDVSRRWFEQHLLAGVALVAPTLLLAEVAGAIGRRTGEQVRAERSVEEVAQAPGLTWVALDLPLAQEAAQLAAERRLRGADAIYVAIARRLGVPLVTWDQEQQTRAAGVADVRIPATDAAPPPASAG